MLSIDQTTGIPKRGLQEGNDRFGLNSLFSRSFCSFACPKFWLIECLKRFEMFNVKFVSVQAPPSNRFHNHLIMNSCSLPFRRCIISSLTTVGIHWEEDHKVSKGPGKVIPFFVPFYFTSDI